MKNIILNRSLIKISGKDKEIFLQRLVTSDVKQLQKNYLQASSLLSPQGKILFSFLLFLQEDDIYIDINPTYAPTLCARLNLYKLNSCITLDLYENIPTLYSEESLAGQMQDNRFPLYKTYGYFSALPKANNLLDLDSYYIDYAIARLGYEFQQNSNFPHDVNYDLIKAVSFNKGCFVGQEVVARMQHRANLKKRLAIIEAEQCLSKNDIIYASQKIAGTIGTAIKHKALAIIRTDYLDNATITCNGQKVKIALPNYKPRQKQETSQL